MSLRSLFSRLLPVSTDEPPLDMQGQNDRRSKSRWWHYIAQFLIVTTLILSAIWLLLAIWYQFGAYRVITWVATTFILGLLVPLLSVTCLSALINKVTDKTNHKTLNLKNPKNYSLSAMR